MAAHDIINLHQDLAQFRESSQSVIHTVLHSKEERISGVRWITIANVFLSLQGKSNQNRGTK